MLAAGGQITSEAHYPVKCCLRASTLFLIIAFVYFSTVGCIVYMMARMWDQINTLAYDVVKYHLLSVSPGRFSFSHVFYMFDKIG